MKFLMVVAALLLPVGTMAQQADTPTPRDFAFGVPLEVDGDGALYSFELPDVVYRYSTRPELGDMRIFNGYEEVVPHLVKPGISQQQPEHEPVALQFFPLYEEAGNGGDNIQVHVATDSSGAVVDFWQLGGGKGGRVLSRYLIDATAVERPIEKLLLEWDEGSDNVLVSIKVEYSDDLVHWKRLADSRTLAQMNHDGYRLEQRSIELPPLKAKYLRINWPVGKKGLQLHSVRAVVKRSATDVPRRWLALTPSGGEVDHGVYDFDAGGYFPVDRVKVKLPQLNTVVKAKLFSRVKGSDTPWRLRHQGLLYSIKQEGHILQNDTIQLGAVTDPYWRLEVDTASGGIGQEQPQLELGWVPNRVYFLARGETPFSLAFGSVAIEAGRSGLDVLLKRLRQSQHGQGFIKVARPGAIHELGGKQRLKPAPPPLPWKKWLLWGVLGLGVLLLALMARHLYRQMHESTDVE